MFNSRHQTSLGAETISQVVEKEKMMGKFKMMSHQELLKQPETLTLEKGKEGDLESCLQISERMSHEKGI